MVPLWHNCEIPPWESLFLRVHLLRVIMQRVKGLPNKKIAALAVNISMHCPHYGSGKCCVCILNHSVWWQTRARLLQPSVPFQTTPRISQGLWPTGREGSRFIQVPCYPPFTTSQKKNTLEYFRAGSFLRGESLVSGQCALVGEEVRRGRWWKLEGSGSARQLVGKGKAGGPLGCWRWGWAIVPLGPWRKH